MKRGFTLIELLVVITLIGILMAIALVSYQGTRKTARDGKRKADLEQIRSALEIYRADCGQYTVSLNFGGSLTGSGVCAGNTYMALVPQDPLYSTYQYRYARGTLNSYNLCAYLEGGSGSVSGCGGNCYGGIACNYQVTQP